MIKKQYDPTHTLSYGYWVCPHCKSSFYGGGPALHERGCTEKGYSGCVYHYGPNEKTDRAFPAVTEAEKQEAQNAN